MRRPALYSSSRSGRPGPGTPPTAVPVPGPVSAAAPRKARFGLTGTRLMWAAIFLLTAALVFSFSHTLRNDQRKLTQEDIDAAVLKTMATQVMPSEYAKAYDNVLPSVVRVVSYVKKSRLKEDPSTAASGSAPAPAPGGMGKPRAGAAKPKPLGPATGVAPSAAPKPADDEEVEQGVGTGVVIIDKGVILTNLHVVSGADRIKVIFSDGLEASKIPDDLIAATMRSTSDLQPGDKVLAVGFPFGIGPSASGGIVSGLKRAFRSPEGKQEMSNLIQFDAAANPGNSGGPLVTMDGEVVGIVTAILNPTPARTFLGIGFAVPIENAATAAGLPPF